MNSSTQKYFVCNGGKQYYRKNSWSPFPKTQLNFILVKLLYFDIKSYVNISIGLVTFHLWNVSFSKNDFEKWMMNASNFMISKRRYKAFKQLQVTFYQINSNILLPFRCYPRKFLSQFYNSKRLEILILIFKFLVLKAFLIVI